MRGGFLYRHILSLSILLLLAQVVVGQNTFSKAYDFDFGLDLAVDVIVRDSFIYMCGTGPDRSINYNYSLKLMKLTIDGDIIWQKRYGWLNSAFSPTGAGCFWIDENDFMYAAGARYDTVSSDCFIAKFDSEGDSIWFRYFGGLEDDAMSAIAYDSASSTIYSVGTVKSFGLGAGDVTLWSLDTNGNTNYIKYYGGSNLDIGNSIVIYEDTLQVSGKTYSYGINGDAYLSKTHKNGDFISDYVYGGNGNDDIASFKFSSEKIFLWHNLDTLFFDGIPTVYSINIEGEVLWRRVMVDHSDGRLYGGTVLDDGTSLYSGVETINGKIHGWLIKLDTVGATIWSRNYNYYPNNPYTAYLYDVETFDGDIFAAGNTLRNTSIGDSTNSDMWLLKLDSMGCLIPGCDTIVDGVNDVSLPNNHSHITVFPNPTHSTATVVINQGAPNGEVSFTLHNLTGQQVQATSHPLNAYGYGEWQVDCSGFSPGIYFYQVSSGAGIVGKGKLVVE